MRKGPIPSRIDLGFHVIYVVRVSKAQMREEMSDDGDEVWDGYSREEWELPGGYWDLTSSTIAIGRWLPLRRQRYVLCHELVHAALDLRDTE